MTDINNEEIIEEVISEEELKLRSEIRGRKEYAELAVKANAENKVIYQHENGEYELIDQVTHNTCIFDGEKWVEDADKKIAYEKLKREANIPTSLSRFQAITVLKLTKLKDRQTLYQATDNYINSLPDDTIENITAKTAWENAQAFKRDSALIKMAQTMFQLTDEQVDQMFINGAKIEA